MDSSAAQGLAGMSAFVMAFAFVIGILWLLVPFAIFGIKPLLRTIVKHVVAVEKQNAELLDALRQPSATPIVAGGDVSVIDRHASKA
jgi:hypothetical protein